MLGDVVAVDGESHGYHWWNRLAGGIELDLTREQFRDGQTITNARLIKRPGPQPRRRQKEYELLRSRVAVRLGWG